MILSLGALVLLVAANTAAPQKTKPGQFHAAPVATMEVPPPPVEVLVRKEPLLNGQARYHYRVVNRSPYPITGLVIGYDEFLGTPELSMGPVGLSDRGVPRTSVRSPSGWTFRVIDTEEDSLLQFEWEISSQNRAILGGDQSDFSVLLPQSSAPNEEGHWAVYLNSSEASYYSAKLRPQRDFSSAKDSSIRVSTVGTMTRIAFDLPPPGNVSVTIFEARGKRVVDLLSGQQEPGAVEVSWDGRDRNGKARRAGTYLVRVETPTKERLTRFKR